MRISPPTRLCVLVVLWNQTDEAVARLVWSGAGRSWVVMRAIDASDGVRALVKGVLPSGGAAIATGRRWVWTRVRGIVGTYLDGGNGVGKIPPGRWSRRVLGGRYVIPNARILPCESRRSVTCSRGALLGLGVGLRVGRYGVLSGLGRRVPSGSRVVGVHRWSRRWVSGIVGVDLAGVGLSECT